MIRLVPTGDLGLDVLTGGGWRLVKRFRDRESATVVVRGGAGSGKTLMGIQVALELARALGGDVAVGCIEILPTEYIAQLQSARPSLDASRIVQLPAHVGESEGPRVFVGLLQSLDPDAPDLVPNLEELADAVKSAGGTPMVFVVDSLIEGYGIGISIDRIDADAVMKFAAQAGYGLVLCEEVATDAQSPWVFAADTVLQLGVESRERGRWIEVRKHRFAPSATGRHEFDLVGASHPEIFPEPHAWSSDWTLETLVAVGWKVADGQATLTPLQWEGSAEIRGAFVLIVSGNADIAQSLAEALRTSSRFSQRTLRIEFDPLVHRIARWSDDDVVGAYVPLAHGAPRALRSIVERFGDVVRENPTPTVGRVVMGDLGSVLAAQDAPAWIEAIRSFVSLIVASGWGMPVIAYDGRKVDRDQFHDRLAGLADVWIGADESDENSLWAVIRERWPRHTRQVALPRSAASAVRLPRPFGRG